MNRLPLILSLLALCLPAAAGEAPRESRVGLMIHFGRDVASAADPAKFDAELWARAAKEAGMTTLVVVARHADGFCLWDSKVAADDVVDTTPLKRDVLRAAADACKKHGLRLGLVYMSAGADPEAVAKPQLKELAGYEAAFILNDAPGAVTMNESRGYRKEDNRWKTAGRMVELLVDRVSGGGDGFLVAGPMPSGELPPQAVQRLGEVGKWMSANRAAVEGVGPSPFKKLRYAKATTAPGKLYLLVSFWPIDGQFVVPVTNGISKAHALATPAEEYSIATEEFPILGLPTTTVGPLAMPKVIVVDIEGNLQPFEYVHRILQGDDGRLVLLAQDGELTATNAKLEKKGANPWNIGYWTNVNDHVSWNAVIAKPGKYNIEVEYSLAPNSGGSEYRLEFGGKHIEVKPAVTKSFTDFTTVTVGTIELQRGEVLITLRPTKKPNVAVMDLRKIELKPQ